jgi:hypothetical protein
LGRVFFTAKAETAKREPAINWSEIESRLQEILAPARAGDCPAETSLPVGASLTLAHDPAFFDELPVTTDQPMSIPGDPLDLPSSLSEAIASLSPHQDIITEFQAADRGFRSIE